MHYVFPQLVDLGEPAFSSKSERGCLLQEKACEKSVKSCGLRGECVGGLEEPKCECMPGWMGPKCITPTTPVALRHSSFVKLTLAQLPDPYHVTLQLRLRLRGRHDGLLMKLAAKPDSVSLNLRVIFTWTEVNGSKIIYIQSVGTSYEFKVLYIFMLFIMYGLQVSNQHFAAWMFYESTATTNQNIITSTDVNVLSLISLFGLKHMGSYYPSYAGNRHAIVNAPIIPRISD